jgi:hypothetical protein
MATLTGALLLAFSLYGDWGVPRAAHAWPEIQHFDNVYTFSSREEMYLAFPITSPCITARSRYITGHTTPVL